MKTIERIEILYAEDPDWTPRDIAYVTELKLVQDSLIVQFLSQSRKGKNSWPDDTNEFFLISISFKRVNKLKINFNALPRQQISGFDICDISSNNWEDINFKIEDYENGSIEFFCEDLKIESLSFYNFQ